MSSNYRTVCKEKRSPRKRRAQRRQRYTRLVWRGGRKVFTQEELKGREGLWVGEWIPGRENSMCRNSMVC